VKQTRVDVAGQWSIAGYLAGLDPDDCSRTGVVVRRSACWRLLQLAEHERAAVRGSLLEVVQLGYVVHHITHWTQRGHLLERGVHMSHSEIRQRRRVAWPGATFVNA
jgi:hypothetical protein